VKPAQNQVFIEFKEGSVHALDGLDGAEFPLERDANGRISAPSKAAVANGLRGFLQRNGIVGQRSAVCAVPARGVTFRTVALPAGVKKEDTNRLLAMQIEAQFPVPPSELAWGYTRIAIENGNGRSDGMSLANGLEGSSAGTKGQAEFFIAAIKRELIEDYTALLSSCGISAQFTVAALARAGAQNGSVHAAGGTRSLGILEVGVERSELLVFDERSVPALRVINWGQKQADQPQALRASLPTDHAGTIYISSVHVPPQTVASQLAVSRRAEVLPVPSGQGITAATHGLRTLSERGTPMLLLGAPEQRAEKKPVAQHWKWAALAAVLLLAAFSLRYAEAMLFRSQLTGKLEELSKYRKTLPNLEREVSFLNFIKTNQPPYLDTVAVIASAAPAGTKLDQLLVARRGDVSLRGSVQDPQGPEKFRTKLIDSGFFSKVVVEEQGPASQQDRNKINFRISGVLKPEGTRKVLPPEPPLTNKTGKAGAPMPGGPEGIMPPDFPPNMPPGAMMPPGARPMPMPPNG
jgi:Tfp pilus assembly PilM family ATPase